MTLANNPERYTADFGGPQDLQDTWRIIAGGAPKAARALIQVAEHGRVEAARVAAAKTLLEFAGFGSKEVPVVRVLPMEYDSAAPKSESRISPAEQIKARMELLKRPDVDPMEASLADLMADDESEVVEAELVEDYPSPGQE